MLEWLIVGGGVHGTHVSHYLTSRGRVPHDRVRVLDPHEIPLARWERWTMNCGMDFLRSPAEHHLDVDPQSLQRLGERAAGGRFRPPNQRPALDLFRAHAMAVIGHYRLDRLRVAGTASGVVPRGGGLRVETGAGAIDARRVVLAIGVDDPPRWPQWARLLELRGAAIEHVFDAGFRRDRIAAGARVAILGGGATAAQLAIALTGAGARVTLISRHAPRVHTLDADFGLLQPDWLAPFGRADPARRRRIVVEERHRGSMPADVELALRELERTRALDRRVDEIVRARLDVDGTLHLELSDDTVRVDRAILATGFESRRPGGAWLDRAILELGLPVAGCGYPLVDGLLQWRRGLYVTGPLAELRLGPAARSIAGARRAAEILALA